MVTHGDDTDKFVAKVGDMGLAMVGTDLESNDTALPIRWAAPECYLKQEFSTNSDVWSFGIVLYELFTCGQVPYQGMTNRQVIDNVSTGYRLDIPENCPKEIYQLMMMCWNEGKRVRKLY